MVEHPGVTKLLATKLLSSHSDGEAAAWARGGLWWDGQGQGAMEEGGGRQFSFC